MVLLKPLPEAVRESVEALVGCIAGAPILADLQNMVQDAGLVDRAFTDKGQAVEAMLPENDPLIDHLLSLLPAGTKPSDYITSMIISARKSA